LMGLRILGGSEEGSCVRIERSVLRFAHRRPRHQVLAEGLAVSGRTEERTLFVQAFGAVGVLLVARPLDAAPISQELVGDPRVVARSPSGAFLPSGKGLLRSRPSNERSPVLVLERHASGEVEKDVQIGARIARWVDRL